MKLSEISIKRPVLATMMSLLLVLFGVVGISRLPVRELPDIDPPLINVQTIYPGASAAVIETQITEPLEDALTSVEGIKKMTSESREQLSSITIEFSLSEDVDVAAQDVRDRVARVRGRLPDDIEEPIVSKQDADANPSLWVALYSERFSTLELTTIAENLFKDRLQTVSGVSSVILGGAKRFAIRLWLDSEKMAARGITVLDVDRALAEQSVELPSGRVESFERELAIETKGQLKTPEEYNDLVIKRDGDSLVRLRDIGYAKVGVEDERSVARYNAKPAVGIGVIKQSKANIIDVAKGIKAELERIQPLIPEGIEYNVPYDESIYIDKSIKEVWITLGIAFFLVVFVIYIFLHNARATLVPAITIPVSIIATFAVLYFFGFSINIITMLAFVLAIGLVVDDAIVVLENIHRHIENGMHPMAASVKGMKEIGFAVIATTVALVAVFLPMAFQTSDTGRLFIEFAVAISFSVMISTFVALTLAPMICARVLKHHDANGKKGILITFEHWINKQRDYYQKFLRFSLKNTFFVILMCVGVVASSVWLFQQLESEFLPDEDKGRLFIIAIAPEGSTSEYTDRMVRKMEVIIADTPEVQGFFTAVALARGGPGQAAQGLSFIRLKSERDKHVRDIVGGPDGFGAKFFRDIEGAFVIPIIPKAIGGGFSQPFQLILQHPDLDELNDFATDFSNTLRQAGFLMNVRSTFELNKPELRVNINRNRAAVLGVSIQDISRTLQIMFGGLDLAKLNLSGKEYDVIVQLERASRLSPSDLEKIYVRNASGQLIQLNNVVDYEVGGGPSSINHFNRMRSATIEATPVDIPLGTAMEKTEVLLKKEMPSSFRYEWDGEAADLTEAGHETLFVIGFALLIIYMVLAAQFESLVHPLVIMFTLPLALFGALSALWIMSLVDQSVASGGFFADYLPRIPAMGINLFSQIGIIMLIGIVTKNGILLVDFANQEVAKGKDPLRAMMEAGKVRFRPILMTAFSTIAGIIPIAIGFGAGAESRRPLGVAAVGGIATGTFLTLFVIPVVYVLFYRLTHPSKKRNHLSGVRSIALFMVFVFGLSGCSTVGKDYTRPVIDMPTAYSAAMESDEWKVATPQDDAHRGEWWAVFKEDRLNTLMEMALKHNHDLKSAIANVEKARALARVDRSRFFPRVEINAEAERARTTKNSFTSVSAASSSFISEQYSVPFDFSYELDIWGKVRRQYEAGVLEAEASFADFQTVLLTLTADVAFNYFKLIELDKEIAILEETIVLREYAHKVVAKRVESGITSELDFNRAKTVLANAKSALVDLKRQRKETENTIAVLCGQWPTRFSIDAEKLAATPPVIPTGVPSELLERRPDIAAQERLLAAANAEVGIAEAAFYPTVELMASAGVRSARTRNLFNWESRVWSLGPNIHIPLSQIGYNRANLAARKAAYIETVENYRQIILTAFEEVETTLSNIQLRKEQAEAQQHALEAARETARLSISRYEQGIVTFLEVVDAERSRLDAELEAANILYERLIATVSLIKAIGGEW